MPRPGVCKKPPRRPGILVWQEKSGLNGSFHESGLLRGTLLDFPDVAVRTPGSQRTAQQPLPTKSILVDVGGGEPLDRQGQHKSPGRILVMDEAGNLLIHDEAAEDKEWGEATNGAGMAGGNAHPVPPPPPDGRRPTERPDDPGIQIGPVRRPGRQP